MSGDPCKGFRGDVGLKALPELLEPLRAFPVDRPVAMIWPPKERDEGGESTGVMEFTGGTWFVELTMAIKALLALALAQVQAGEREAGFMSLRFVTSLTHGLVPARGIELVFARGFRSQVQALVNGLARHGHIPPEQAGELRAMMRLWPLDERLAAMGEVLYCLEGVRLGGGPAAMYGQLRRDGESGFSLRESMELIDNAVAVIEQRPGVRFWVW
jgi:hypothetical protein